MRMLWFTGRTDRIQWSYKRNSTSGLETILGTADVQNDYLNPYTRNPRNNPPTFLTVGEHVFLKIETLGYGVKLHEAGVEVKMVLYKGFGHAYFDNTGVYPQCEDCIEEMGEFILRHCGWCRTVRKKMTFKSRLYGWLLEVILWFIHKKFRRIHYSAKFLIEKYSENHRFKAR